MTVRFNIINLSKSNSLFSKGMKISIFSEKENLNGSGWYFGGENITYSNSAKSFNDNKGYFTLSFSFKFPHSKDEVYFAYSRPYTYTQLLNDINELKEKSK